MLDLYYYNHKVIQPVILIICKIYSDKDYELLEENADYIFDSLIKTNIANVDNILIFNIIKEHKNNIINLLLPSKLCNIEILKQLENNDKLQDKIILETVSNINCNTLISLDENELKIKDCNLNLKNWI